MVTPLESALFKLRTTVLTGCAQKIYQEEAQAVLNRFLELDNQVSVLLQGLEILNHHLALPTSQPRPEPES